LTANQEKQEPGKNDAKIVDLWLTSRLEKPDWPNSQYEETGLDEFLD
jgi:hypothetical protein